MSDGNGGQYGGGFRQDFGSGFRNPQAMGGNMGVGSPFDQAFGTRMAPTMGAQGGPLASPTLTGDFTGQAGGYNPYGTNLQPGGNPQNLPGVSDYPGAANVPPPQTGGADPLYQPDRIGQGFRPMAQPVTNPGFHPGTGGLDPGNVFPPVKPGTGGMDPMGGNVGVPDWYRGGFNPLLGRRF